MNDEYPKECPGCLNNTLIKKDLPDGRYVLVCTKCGLRRGPFKPDKGKGVV